MANDISYSPPATSPEIAYDQITASVNVSSTNSAAPTVIIPGTAHTYDGTPCWFELFAPSTLLPNSSGAYMVLGVGEAGAFIGSSLWAVCEQSSVAARQGAYIRVRFTPSAGSHTYQMVAIVSSTLGTPQVVCGVGGSTNSYPAYLRIVKA
jgi:hypothetical protein